MKKLIFLFLLFTNLLLFSGFKGVGNNATDSVLHKRVTICMKDVTLEEVLNEAVKQTDAKVFFNVDKIRAIPVSYVSEEEISFLSLLDILLENSNISYTIRDNTVILRESPIKKRIEDQKKVVKGIVRDEDGKILPGAFIKERSGKRVAVSDDNGEFTLFEIDKGETIIFTFMGMRTLEIEYSGEEWLEIQMKVDPLSLEQLVFTGYQTISRDRAAGSFSVIPKERIDKGSILDVTSKIEGIAPGLSVYKGDVKIRGISTIRGKSTPLYIVDGFPLVGDINSINPKDITHITLLKDASAASIYGAQAANGVVVVTTQGGVRGAPRINIESAYSVTPMVNFDKYNFSSSQELVDLEVESFDRFFAKNPWATVKANKLLLSKVYDVLYKKSEGVLSNAEANLEIERLRNSDNRSQLKDYVLRPRQINQHSISVSGGSDNSSYYLSGLFRGTSESLRGNKNESVNLNLKSDFTLFNKLRVDIGSNITIYNAVNNAISGSMLYYPSYEMLKDDQGEDLAINFKKPYYEISRLLDANLFNEAYYPLKENSYVDIGTKNFNTRNYISLKYNIIAPLTFEFKYQFERGNGVQSNHYGESSNTALTMINDFAQIDSYDNSIKFNIPYGGQLIETRGNNFSQTLRAQINYEQSSTDGNHYLYALAGAERRKMTTSSFTVQRFGYNGKDNTYSPINSLDLGFIFGTESMYGYSFYNETLNNRIYESDDRYVSFYSNASYSYLKRYSFTGSIRVDQSNLWGTDPSVQYKPLWSLGGAWLLSDENFFDLPWIDRLNVRLTYGINGNIPKDTGPYVKLSPYYSSSLFLHGYSVASPPNYNLTWERTAVTNIGFDINFLKNRLNTTIELYNKKTTDLLGPITTDPTQGFQSIIVNYGSMFNRGVEFGIYSRNIEKRDFSWNTSLNVAYNKNEMTDITHSVLAVSAWAGNIAHVVGKPYGSVYAYRWAGVSSTGEPQVYNENDDIVLTTSGVQSIEALKCVGTLMPNYSGGFENFFRYKNFSLSFLFVFYGGNIFKKDVPEISGTNRGLSSNFNKALNDRWMVEGDELKTDIPKFDIAPDNYDRANLYRAVEQHWAPADFIKLRNIEFTYNLPKDLLKKINFSNASIKFFANNLFYLAKNREGLDPEMFSSEGVRNPTAPNYTFSLNITF
ncbi:MAG: SusC/RagA family TonB-linked outer membrane protein [Bacteroidales bacterium]